MVSSSSPLFCSTWRITVLGSFSLWLSLLVSVLPLLPHSSSGSGVSVLAACLHSDSLAATSSHPSSSVRISSFSSSLSSGLNICILLSISALRLPFIPVFSMAFFFSPRSCLLLSILFLYFQLFLC